MAHGQHIRWWRKRCGQGDAQDLCRRATELVGRFFGVTVKPIPLPTIRRSPAQGEHRLKAEEPGRGGHPVRVEGLETGDWWPLQDLLDPDAKPENRKGEIWVGELRGCIVDGDNSSNPHARRILEIEPERRTCGSPGWGCGDEKEGSNCHEEGQHSAPSGGDASGHAPGFVFLVGPGRFELPTS
jgi:hypothetical protein